MSKLKLMSFEELVKKTDLANYTAGSSHLVEVTHINDPGSFYVRPINLEKALDELEKRGRQITPQEINKTKRIIYKSTKHKKYIRGDIQDIQLDVNETVCAINAIDYGCFERDIPIEDIYLPNNYSYAQYTPIAVHCQLYFCYPKVQGEPFDEEAIEAMNFFCGQHAAKITVQYKNMDKLTVELKTVECPHDVGTMLALLHFTSLTGPACMVNQIDTLNMAKYIQYKSKNVKIGDKIAVRVQSGDSMTSFYVAEMNDYKTYIKAQCDFGEYCKRLPVADITAMTDGQSCGVKIGFPPNYERAVIKKVIKPDTCLVKLVDWGQDKEVSFDCVKMVVSEGYTKLPAIAMHCSSTEDQVWKNGLPKFLFPGYQFIIEIVTQGSEDMPHKVNLFRMPQF